VRRDKCKCNMRTQLVGDGCQYCNPDLHIECLEDCIKELESENEHLIHAIEVIQENYTKRGMIKRICMQVLHHDKEWR